MTKKGAKRRKSKFQWRRYKIGTLGVIIAASVSTLLIYMGISLFPQKAGIMFIAAGIVLYSAIAYDIYRMYGY